MIQRNLRFSTVILSIVLAALLLLSSSLLFLAYQGSQTALSAEKQLTYQQDKLTIERLFNVQRRSINTQAEEIARRYDIRSSLLAQDYLTISMLLSESIRSEANSQIDMLLVEAEGMPAALIKNSSVFDLNFQPQNISKLTSSSRRWDIVKLTLQDKTYVFQRLVIPVISTELGEVMGTLSAYTLLNDNLALLSQLREATGAAYIELTHKQEPLARFIEDSLATRNGMRTTLAQLSKQGNGSIQTHTLNLEGDHFDLTLYKPGNSQNVLQSAYNRYLWTGFILALLLSLAVMLVIRTLTRRSLAQLLNYTNQVTNQDASIAFQAGAFIEFNRVGQQLEAMLSHIKVRELKLDAIFTYAPSLMFIKGTDLKYQVANPKIADLLGLEPSMIVGCSDFDIFPPELAATLRETDQQVLTTQAPLQFEYNLKVRGQKRHFLSTKFPLINEHGTLYAIGGIATEITDKITAKAEAQITDLVFEAAAEAIIVMNAEGKVITNSSFSRMTGYSSRRARAFAKHLLNDHPDIEISLQNSGRWQGESLRRRANGEPLPIWASISLISGADGGKSYIAVFSDISELKAAERKLEQLAHYDPLTGLPNRTLFYDRFASSLGRSARHKRHTALLFIDLDRFKPINDMHGHQTGDAVLIEVARRIQKHIRPDDTLSRLGGDEFTVILDGLDACEKVQLIAQRILQELKAPIMLGDKQLDLSASIGIALYPKDGLDAQTLLKHADTAMYHVKERGRNAFMFFDEALNVQAQAHRQLEEDLNRAVHTSQLFLVFQPRFHIDGQQILSAEALIRWQHPSQGIIPPNHFIPLAEESNLIVEIGRDVLLQACQAAAHWNRFSHRPVPVSVNLSARQLHDAQLLNDIRQALYSSGLEPALLELEITETMVIEDMEHVITTLQEIRTLGVSLSVDDFGTGYSSLIYLKRLPVNTVKIDRSFIDDVPGNEDGESLVEAIISMSHTLKLNVVAEGVETSAQLDFLRAKQCDEVQGFLLGKPGDISKIQLLVAQPDTKA